MIQVKVGTAWPLELQLGDGSAIKFPVANVYAAISGVPIATVNLTHLAGGMYGGTYTFAAAGEFFVQYVVYTDVAHTILDPTYDIVLEDVLSQSNDLDSIPASILNALVGTVYTLKQYLVIIGSAVAGKANNAPANTVFRDLEDTKNVITSTADVSGNRTGAVYNP